MQTLSELIPKLKPLGGREAIRGLNPFSTRIITYSGLYGKIGACASYLHERGLTKGSRVLIWAENSPEWVALFWACVARGVQIVPVDFRFSPGLVSRIREDCGAALTADSAILDELALRRPVQNFVIAPADPDDIVEIVYTSGTTGEPHGIVHRHRNICANLDPFEKEIAKYRRWALPFQPVRILNLLPFSHMFGQSMGLYIPVFLGGAVILTSEVHPGIIQRMICENRGSVVVCVPQILESLGNEIKRQFRPGPPPRWHGLTGVAARWWKYRKIHSRLGWKFWAFVVGGARVEPQLEEFWANLGYIVIQGYGLTEASPVVAVNHPFSTKRGSLGKPVPGQEVRIATDGEILVRGASVAGEADAEGWLHTGDLGELDTEGRLYYRGRKKDVIVTPEGLNVCPEDVEAALNQSIDVRDSAVVSIGDRVHAALILKRSEAPVEEIIRDANRRLEAHQRIRDWSVWPDEDFPRTASTLKVRRGEVAARIQSGLTPTAIRTAPVLDPAAMSSLDRVELLAELETRLGIEIDESAFAQATTVEKLRQFMAQPVEARRAPPLPVWPTSLPARLLRQAFQSAIAIPLFRHYLPLRIEGVEHLAGVSGPVIFAANHTSHLDTPAIFSALPTAWRKRLAPAMRAEHFNPQFVSQLEYRLARLMYNAYPLPQQMAGMQRAFGYTANLVRKGYCPLVYPEGRRTPDGKVQPFQSGVGMMAVRLQVPVIPLYIAGLFDVYSVHDSWPKPGPVLLKVGPPLSFAGSISFQAAAQSIEDAIRTLAL